MRENSIAPEPLTKLVWRFDTRISNDIHDDYDIFYSEQLSNPRTTGENVHLVERYLFEVGFLLLLLLLKSKLKLYFRQLKHRQQMLKINGNDSFRELKTIIIHDHKSKR